jgi:hypothetical protein
MPCGVVVSMGSRKLRKCAPLASSCSMTARRWQTERGQAVEPDHDQRLAGPDVAQQARKHRSGAIGTGGALLVHGAAAGGAQFVELRIGALLFGGHPTDQAA